MKIALHGKSEKWIEGAYTYLINSLEETYFTREDVVMALMPWIHGTAMVKEYTVKHKAWCWVKELEKMNVLESNNPSQHSAIEEKKSSNIKESANQL